MNNGSNKTTSETNSTFSSSAMFSNLQQQQPHSLLTQQQHSTSNANKLDDVLIQSKDAQTMVSVLKDMGIDEFEPRVINQLLEFSYS